jgi:hypothetical protein
MLFMFDFDRGMSLRASCDLALFRNRDREEPRDSPPPTPPGIRITYHGGSVD